MLGQKRWRIRMSQPQPPTIAAHFGQLEDPRRPYLVVHPLLNLLTIALCGIIAGAENWADVERFGHTKREWLSRYLDLSNGIPSHDTFGYVFARLNPAKFQECFLSWVRTAFGLTGKGVAIDGKKLRGSFNKRLGKKAIELVSAWATQVSLVLGQVKVDEASNEITAIPLLLALLELKGCLVTIDAAGCQTEIAQQIVQQGGDYLLSVKENQAHLYEDIALFFRLAQQNNFAKVPHTFERTVDKDHGRIEIRECWAVSGQEPLSFLRDDQAWPKLSTIVMIMSERRQGNKVERKTRYYISSLTADAQRLLEAKRAHWGIENSLHWLLDVAFHEDDRRARQGHSAHNFAILRRIALNLLKQEKTAKGGIVAKRLQAGWNDAYLLKVLASPS